MKITRTVKLKLKCSPTELLPTIKLYTESFNKVCSVGWEDQDFNGVSLHHKTYKHIREYLPSQLAVTSRMKATEALKSIKKKKKTSCPQSKLSSIRYDARSYNAMLDKGAVSLLTVSGRKVFKTSVPECFIKYLSWRRTTADLFLKNNKLFLHIVFEKDIADPVLTGETVGIDRGINKIAVTSANKFYSGKSSKRIISGYRKLRDKLQSKGTPSAKRHLKRLSQKENSYRADVNHCVSKSIVAETNPGAVLVLEDLKSIRQNCRFRKKQRAQVHNWSYFQLQQFLTYKATEKGIAVEYVDSRYTSQKCSVCGYTSRSNRASQANFKCKKCGLTLNADLNASRNIRQNYLTATCGTDRAAVNQPIVASDDTQILRGLSGA